MLLQRGYNWKWGGMARLPPPLIRQWPHRPENVRQQRDILWPDRGPCALYHNN